jgi:hypothetical protein
VLSNRFRFSSSGQRVFGRFQAEGGRGNDIKVYIFDEDRFLNWQNHHNANTYYDSGKVTVGRIDVALRSGIYYLVFDNMTFSLKTVPDKNRERRAMSLPLFQCQPKVEKLGSQGRVITQLERLHKLAWS